jgi:hypothetical protein
MNFSSEVFEINIHPARVFGRLAEKHGVPFNGGINRIFKAERANIGLIFTVAFFRQVKAEITAGFGREGFCARGETEDAKGKGQRAKGKRAKGGI